MPAQRVHDEAGASLVIAIVFMVLFTATVGAILGLGIENHLVTTRYEEERTDAYAADGGVDGAIQFIRQVPTRCNYGQACPTFTVTVDGRSVTVTPVSMTTILDLDRTVEFTATVNGGLPLTRAVVIYRDDGASVPTNPVVDVTSWEYLLR